MVIVSFELLHACFQLVNVPRQCHEHGHEHVLGHHWPRREARRVGVLAGHGGNVVEAGLILGREAAAELVPARDLPVQRLAI